jgi:hypothetical protein
VNRGDIHLIGGRTEPSHDLTTATFVYEMHATATRKRAASTWQRRA